MKDANGAEASVPLQLTVNPAPSFTAKSPFTPVTAGVAATRAATVAGGTPPLVWSVKPGSLPVGFTLDPATGTLGGTATAAGSWKLNIQAEDANGARIASDFELVVQTPLAIETPAALASGRERSAYRATVTVTGGTGPYRWQITSGALPQGVFLDESSGVISGTPIVTGDFTFLAKVDDQGGQTANRTFTLHVDPAPSFRVNPDVLMFSVSAGGPASAPQSVELTSTPANADVVIKTTAAWLKLSLSSVITPAVIQVTAEPGSLEPGIYTGVITADGPEARVVAVTLTVGAVQERSVSADPAQLRFSVKAGEAVRQQIVLITASGPIEDLRVTTAGSASAWLSATPASVKAGSGQGAMVSVAVDASVLAAGSHSGEVVIGYGGASVKVPVEVAVDSTVDFELSYTGLAFRAAAGTPIAMQQVLLLNRAADPLAWVSSADDWIVVDPPSGTTSTSSVLGIRAGAQSLEPGSHTGKVTVTPLAGGVSRELTVHLDLTSGAATPVLEPSGLVFRAEAGETPAQQTISITNPSAAPVTFVSSSSLADQTGWLAYGPITGSLEPGGTAKISVGVAGGGLTAGMRRASLTFEFSDGTIRVVEVALSVRSASCEATRLVPVLTRTAQHFAAEVGWPQAIEALILDDCGNTAGRATGIVSFSNGVEGSLPLIPLETGVFTATWVPKEPRQSITITVSAREPAGGLTGTVEATGSVVANTN